MEIKKQHLIDLICTLVKRRLPISDDINLSSDEGFSLNVKKYTRYYNGLEGPSFSIKAGDGFRPREASGKGHNCTDIISELRKLLESFDYGYNSGFIYSVYFQLPENYQTEIIPYYKSASFIRDFSSIHYSNGRLKRYISSSTDAELEAELNPTVMDLEKFIKEYIVPHEDKETIEAYESGIHIYWDYDYIQWAAEDLNVELRI